MSTHHELKLWPDYFQAKMNGLKPWEHRECIDRDFKVGDTVTFREYDPCTGQYTGRQSPICNITYVHPLPRCMTIFTHDTPPNAPVHRAGEAGSGATHCWIAAGNK